MDPSSKPLHKGLFSWPKSDWYKTGSSEAIGIDLIEENVLIEATSMVKKAVTSGRDESFAIFDMGVVAHRYWTWKDCFPTIQPFFAMKVHDDPAIVSMLNQMGAGFDCASKNELQLALSLGVNPERIIFANTTKFPSHLRYAEEHGITLMTFDCEEELLKVKQYAPSARLVLRIKAMNVGEVQYEISHKFGSNPTQAKALLNSAKKNGMNIVGISFHIGSGCSDPIRYNEHIRAARQVFDEAEKLGIKMSLLDIGGGFYGVTGAEEILYKMKESMNSTIAELFPKGCGVRVISEPGRYFVESAMMIVPSIVAKRKPERLPDNNSVINGENLAYTVPRECTDCDFEYFLSESGYAMFASWYWHLTQPPVPYVLYTSNTSEFSSNKTYPSKLWGPTCDCLDVINHKVELPELFIGDWVGFPDCGAYMAAVVTTFNGMPLCPIRRVMKKEVWDKVLDYINKD